MNKSKIIAGLSLVGGIGFSMSDEIFAYDVNEKIVEESKEEAKNLDYSKSVDDVSVVKINKSVSSALDILGDLNNVSNVDEKIKNEVAKEKKREVEEANKKKTESTSNVNTTQAIQESSQVIATNTSNPHEAFNRIVAEKGLSQSQANNWAAIITRESGWQINATNPSSGAYGLPQALPGGKMASHGADWQTNPYTQLSWMYDYMVQRYGGIDQALAYWNAHHWY